MPELKILPNRSLCIDVHQSELPVLEHLRTAVDRRYRGNRALILRLLHYVAYEGICAIHGDAVVIGTSVNPKGTTANLHLGGTIIGKMPIAGKPTSIMISTSANHTSTKIWDTVHNNNITHDSGRNEIHYIPVPRSRL